MLSRFKFGLFALLVGAAMFAAPLAAFACCPSDGNGDHAAKAGLGQSHPVAPDLSPDSTWSVYEFERDGVRYVQINDSTGAVRVAVGRIADTFWVMPIGTDADRVSVPGSPKAIPSYSNARLVYSTKALEVWLHQTSSSDWWTVGPASTR
ncbi:hypothetical protein ACFOLC_00250 [Lysobacter cavernae]|uniref:Secreted protein n=1 Tax=Lysobacter cavernae TaxID=1685901 RepID=A0ABV7RND8_9GAMM